MILREREREREKEREREIEKRRDIYNYSTNTFYSAVLLLDFYNLGWSWVSNGLEGH